MPYDYVQTILGCSFLLAWAFIGGMILRDSLDETRRHRIDPPGEDKLPEPHVREGRATIVGRSPS